VATSVNITGRGVIPAGVTIEPGLPNRATTSSRHCPSISDQA
jgi:hypothetical protein